MQCTHISLDHKGALHSLYAWHMARSKLKIARLVFVLLIFLSVISAWSVLIYICFVIHMYIPVAFHFIINLLCKHILQLVWHEKFVECPNAFILSICFPTVLLFFSSMNRNATMKINIHLDWSQVSSEISNSIPRKQSSDW